MMTNDEKEQLEAVINAGVAVQDILDLAQEMLDIRKGTGWGRIELTMRCGEITEREVTQSRKPKIEKRNHNT